MHKQYTINIVVEGGEHRIVGSEKLFLEAALGAISLDADNITAIYIMDTAIQRRFDIS